MHVRMQYVLLGPFHGAIAVPSVTRCRCRRCRCRRRRWHRGHRCAGGVRQYSGDTWWIGVRRLVVANGPNIFQMFLVKELTYLFTYLLLLLLSARVLMRGSVGSESDDGSVRVGGCRKWCSTWRWSTTIGSVHRSRSGTCRSAVRRRAQSWSTGATCWPTRADRSRSGTRFVRSPTKSEQ